MSTKDPKKRQIFSPEKDITEKRKNSRPRTCTPCYKKVLIKLFHAPGEKAHFVDIGLEMHSSLKALGCVVVVVESRRRRARYGIFLNGRNNSL